MPPLRASQFTTPMNEWLLMLIYSSCTEHNAFEDIHLAESPCTLGAENDNEKSPLHNAEE